MAVQKVLNAANTNITAGGTYTIAKGFSGTITVNTTKAVTIAGASAGNLKNVHIKVESDNADLTIKDLNVYKDYSDNGLNMIAFGKGKTAAPTVRLKLTARFIRPKKKCYS